MKTPLTPQDRAELCSRVDFPGLLVADGLVVELVSGHFWAAIRPEERTPSCRLYRPGEGRHGAKGWTWHDHGPDVGGDALGYLLDVRGMPFPDAVRFLAERTGYWPEGWRPGENVATVSPRIAPKPQARYPDTPRIEPLSINAQAWAVARFIAALETLHPTAGGEGKAYLEGRGCLPPGDLVPLAWKLPRAVVPVLAHKLAEGGHAGDLERAGLLKLEAGKPPRLPWWTDSILLASTTEKGAPLYLTARRLDWEPGDRVGKYLNTPTAGGAVRHAFGLPNLYPGNPRWVDLDLEAPLLLVEGILDALGAMVLGWPALAMLSRPGARGIDDRHGAAEKLLGDHLPALRDFRRVLVVPDADAGEKGDTGEALAAKLVGWLRAAGCRADVATLAELCPDAPEGCKDLADVAEKRSQLTTF